MSVVAILSFKQRVLRASAWTFGGHMASQALRLGSNLIMTRLLVPEMFGVMTLANVIMVGLALFSDVGLAQGVVQSRRGNDQSYLNTVWTLQILRGGVMWLLALGIGLAIHLLGRLRWLPEASVYADPLIPYVIAVLSFNALIGGFASTRLAVAWRNFALWRVILIELVSQALALAFMIAWTFWDRSVWVLVAGGLASTTLRVWLSHTVLPGGANVLHWDQAAFREILGFGRWIFLTSILGFLSANGDRLLLSGLTDPTTLGFYAIAFFMINAMQETFSKLGSQVAFPAFSEVVRERREVLKRAYYRFRLPIDITTLLITGLLFSAGHLLIDFLYDQRYQMVGHMLEILSISLFDVRFTLASQCFIAMGLPKLLVPIMMVRLVAVFGLMPPAYAVWGIDGALWIAGGSMAIVLPIIFYLKFLYGLLDLRRELAVLPLLALGYGLGLMLDHTFELLGWVP